MSLLLINGPPGVAKSTLARRYAADLPLCLVLDVDLVRAQLSTWAENLQASGTAARELAFSMAQTHLAAGHDVVVPQLLAKRPFAEHLTQLGGIEVLLWTSLSDTTARFRARAAHEPAAPQDSDEAVAGLYRSLEQLDVPRVVSVPDDVEATYAHLRAFLAQNGRP